LLPPDRFLLLGLLPMLLLIVLNLRVFAAIQVVRQLPGILSSRI
jgi:hypothetical protein